MSTRNWMMRFEDILEAIERIQHYTAELSYDQWQDDQKTKDAVVRNIEIIGEAANHIPTEIQEHFIEIPWNKMRGIRNVLIHEYFGVDAEVLWKTVQDDLPELKNLLLSVIKKLR